MQTFRYTHTEAMTCVCHLWFVLYSFDKTEKRHAWSDLTNRS